LLGDFHIDTVGAADRALRAVELALDEFPDMVCLVGDFVGGWTLENPAMVGNAMAPLLEMEGSVVAIPGNRDYQFGDASLLAPILDELNIHYLRNEAWSHEGITWIGIDSANEGEARPELAQLAAREMNPDDPQIVLWHEPDQVDRLEPGPVLQMSGHTHGGQFRLPGGITPVHPRNGSRYVQGFYPEANVPLYVTRGVGTTLMPVRFLCPPEVSILTLEDW
jgi:hypothetical protein